MTEAERDKLVQWMTLGNTVPTILKLCAAYGIVTDYAAVTQVFIDSYREIAEARNQLNKAFLAAGLGNKLERARRIADHVENIEEKAEGSPQWSNAYVKGMIAIDELLAPMQKYELPENHPWIVLMGELVQQSPTKALNAPPTTTPLDTDLISESGIAGQQILNGSNPLSEDLHLSSNLPFLENSTDGQPLPSSHPFAPERELRLLQEANVEEKASTPQTSS